MSFKRFALLAGFLLASMAWAGPYSDLSQKLDHARTYNEGWQAVSDAGLAKELKPLRSGDQGLGALRDEVRLRALVEGGPGAKDEKPSEEAAKIKRDPFFQKGQAAREENWLVRALGNIKSDQSQESRQSVGSGLGGGLTYLVWIILGILAVAFLALAGWFLWTSARSTKKSTALLEDEEPLRSSDEWLEIGDAANKAGDGRSAIRAYYLASLLRLDELGVLPFQRGETNWQHLQRLMRDGSNARLGFDTPTRRFDEVWFGSRPIQDGEVARFRDLVGRLEGLVNQK